MKKVMFVMLAGAAILLLSCDIFGGKEENYFPTTVGSKWDYTSVILLETSGTDATPDTIQTMTINLLANKKDKLDSGEDVTEMVATVTTHIYSPTETTYTSTDTSYVQETSNAVLTYESKSDTAPDTSLVIPLAKDKTWHVNADVIAKVLDQEDITVTAGTYKKAWKIEQTVTSLADKQYYWYANNVGMVKAYWEQDYGTAKVTFSMELTSATIK
ncbi:MAG: hypothetical protein ABIK23_06725 [candidate division WOR-3 bacterium]